MRLLRLAHDEGVELLAMAGGVMHHRGRDRVSAEGEAADGIEVEIRGQFAHDLTNKWRCNAVKGHPTQVNVVIGLSSARENHLAAHHGLLDDLVTELIPRVARHAPTLCSAP